jgi:hypothetical protein
MDRASDDVEQMTSLSKIGARPPVAITFISLAVFGLDALDQALDQAT